MTSAKHERAALLEAGMLYICSSFSLTWRENREVFMTSQIFCPPTAHPSIRPKLYGPATAQKMVPVNREDMIFCLCTTMQCQLMAKCIVEMIPRPLSGSQKSMKTSPEDSSCSPVGLAIRNSKLHSPGDHIIYRKHIGTNLVPLSFA
jgi:hypothetical protein